MDKRQLTAEELLEHLYRGLNMEPDVQTEMDAQDLRELVPGESLEPTQPIDPPAPAAPPPAAASPAPASVENNAAAAEARRARARLILGFTVVLTGAIVTAALYESPVPRETGESYTRVALASVERAGGWLEPASAEAPPVLFANPFDESEIFEFPAGTSEHDARDAVAGYLLKRAMERQASLR
jgi:hypothetical protein